MFTKYLLGLAAAGVIALSALTGSAGTAAAGASVHVGVGMAPYHGPGVRPRPRCWLPERHLCGPAYRVPVHRGPVYRGPVYYGGYWAPAFYFGTAYHPRFYHHARAARHCHTWRRAGHAHRSCHRHW